MYTQTLIVNSNLGEAAKHVALAAMMDLLERCSEWDDITLLANHQTVKNHLLKSIIDICSGGHHVPEVNPQQAT